MSGATDQLTIVINALFVFAMVSYVSSAATDGLASLFKRRETLLAWAVAQLLDDKRFDGLALEVYNNPHVNPLVSGTARNKAELGVLPARIDPPAFATALLEVLHVIPNAPTSMERIQPLPVDGTLPDATRIENAVTNATRRIEADAEDDSKSRHLIQLLTNLIRRCAGQRDLMEQSVALWFEAAMRTVTDQYRKEVMIWNFVIGFGIAAVLDLRPIPVGGLTDGASGHGAQVAQAVPMLVNLFEWTVVAASTLFGAQVWFNLLRFAVTRGGGKDPVTPTPGAPAEAAAPSAGPGGGRVAARRKSSRAAA